MKKEGFLWVVLSFGCIIGLWVATHFREVEENYFLKINSEHTILQKRTRELKKDLEFMRSHQNEIDYLFEKSWFFPKNRLLVGEFLESLRPLLNRVSYRFDPETVKNLNEEGSFKMTQIFFEGDSPNDVELYTFLDHLCNEFPGILIPRDLVFTRQNEPPHGVQGKFIFEWYAMGEKTHEN